MIKRGGSQKRKCYLGDLLEFLKVIGLVIPDKHVDSNTGQVTHSYFIR